jgi:hypothetical protein
VALCISFELGAGEAPFFFGAGPLTQLDLLYLGTDACHHRRSRKHQPGPHQHQRARRMHGVRDYVEAGGLMSYGAS